ncbi:hypothetical protein Pmar_PMAR023900 [Perkinsus marinus ATCC 50983]|uniref:CCHC-type domain-containing protein n=1 Tax=Perkinsus marinus (strain ATCC 50983 / TXsc) TaxID=423536 RepID=C5LRF7_PERM5|nr:hypothetical protein Pmar_PMAR023900 [Perkinsus marinus ATCC 50983]EER00689.1 hypothetical protein Pmar_PMAR023900 [Perkinsus marinus ATCC 50983]|eukprot:XP_002767971.1 hypothetical protein Pmar_PMAR023900 [Perkinsus marinus ATCC 50983]
MAPKDDEVKAIFRRGLKLALWALDRTNLKVDQFISKSISREEEMNRLGILGRSSDSISRKAYDKNGGKCKAFASTDACRFGDRCRYAHTKDTSRGEPTRPKDISDIGPTSTVTIAPTPKPAGEATLFSPSTTRKMICYKCRREGHISKNCPMHNLVTDNATNPLKAVGFYYVEPIRIFDSMTVDFKAASPANVAQSCSLKALLDTGAKRKYIDSILAEEICSCLSTTIADLSTPHVSSQVDDTTLKATRFFKLYLSTDKPVLGDPILQYLVLDKLSPKAIIGLDGMKRLGTEIVLDDKLMVQF